MAEVAFDRVIDALHQYGSKVRTLGSSRAEAQCPGHEDRKPSLSLRQVEGQALVYCQAYCSTADVLAVLGLTMADLFDDRRGATYRYDDGRIVQRYYSGTDKRFTQSGNTTSSPVLYRLAEVKKAVSAGVTVYLVEGEKDVHAIESVGATATTAPMGAKNFSKVDVSPLKGATVIAVADRDAGGKAWAALVHERLDGYAASLQLVEAKSGKDAADHIAAGHGLGDFTAIDAPAASAAKWDDPLPLGWSTKPVPWPADVFPPAIEQYVRSLAEATQTPVDLPGAAVLGILSASIGGKVEVQCPTWIEPTNLFIVPVLPPASRKSAVIAACRAPLTAAERNLQVQLSGPAQLTFMNWQVLDKRAEALKTIAGKADGTKEQLADAQGAVQLAEEARQQIVTTPRLSTSDATPEALVSLLAEQGGRIAAISSEAGLFGTLTGRYSRSANLDPVLMAHAGDAITVDRRSRGTEHVEAPALTLLASIQPYALKEMLERDDFAGRGLLARVLWSLPADNTGNRRVRGVKPVPQDQINAYHARIVGLAQAAHAGEKLTLGMTPEATEVFYEYAERIEEMLKPKGRLGEYRLTREWGGKLVGAAARIAGCLHAAAGTQALKLPISEATMKAAIRLAEYFRAHAVAALTPGDDERTTSARTVLEVLVDRMSAPGTFTVRDLHRRVPRHLQNSEGLRDVLNYLSELGWVQASTEGRGWALHPKAAEALKGADTADIADSKGDTAGHRNNVPAHSSSAPPLTPADRADSRQTVSSVSGSADGVSTSASAPATRRNSPAVSSVSAVSTSDPFDDGNCPECHWPYGSNGHHDACGGRR